MMESTIIDKLKMFKDAQAAVAGGTLEFAIDHSCSTLGKQQRRMILRWSTAARCIDKVVADYI